MKACFIAEKGPAREVPFASITNDSGRNQLGNNGAEVTGKLWNIVGQCDRKCVDGTNPVKKSKDLDETGLVPDDVPRCGPDL